MADHSKRRELQTVLGDVGSVHRYRWTPDARHRFTGWWMTPADAVAACECEACVASRGGVDVYLGSVTRTALFDTGRIAQEHYASAHAAA